MAREAGASVMLLEASPKIWRGGNSQHTRNLRCMHDEPQDVLIDAYPEEEYWQDLLKVTGGLTDEKLARIAIRASSSCRDWMRSHGVHFQPPLSGALHVARTNAFFMGGGKALVNAYYRSAERLGVKVRYNTQVTDIELDGVNSSPPMWPSMRLMVSIFPQNVLKPGPACWRPAASNPTVNGCVKPGVRTNAVNGHRTIS